MIDNISNRYAISSRHAKYYTADFKDKLDLSPFPLLITSLLSLVLFLLGLFGGDFFGFTRLGLPIFAVLFIFSILLSNLGRKN
jgi:hypothetical protein